MSSCDTSNLIRNCNLIISICPFAEEKHSKDCEDAFNRLAELSKSNIKDIEENYDCMNSTFKEIVANHLSNDILELVKARFHTLEDTTPSKFLMIDLIPMILNDSSEDNLHTIMELSDKLADILVGRIDYY
jgi:hypothetical protein